MSNQEQQTERFTDAGEEKVAALLGSLKRVDPPGDFDMRVRARVAQGRPAAARPSWFPVTVRLAAPAAILVIAGGYFGYNALYREGNVNVPVVAESRQATPSAAVTQPTVESVTPPAAVPTTEIASSKPAAEPGVSVAEKPKKPAAADKTADQPTGGSVDLALREANTVSGVNSNAAKSTLSVREVFAAMGIRASRSGSGWRVSSASGAAAAAGLKAGDIIESVNGQPVGANTVFESGFTGRTVGIKRDGVSLTLKF